MSPSARPIIIAEVVFLQANEGGRSQPPMFDRQHTYRPHIVIQSRDVRRPATDADGVNREPYKGVAFLEGPSDQGPGHAGQFVLEHIYHPDVPYSDVHRGPRSRFARAARSWDMASCLVVPNRPPHNRGPAGTVNFEFASRPCAGRRSTSRYAARASRSRLGSRRCGREGGVP